MAERTEIETTSQRTPVERVGDRLERYAERGIFRSFSRPTAAEGKGSYRLRWHRDRVYDVELDTTGDTTMLVFLEVLPEVPEDSEMYRHLESFLAARQDPERLEHRRIDPERCRVLCRNRDGTVAVGVEVLDDDLEYAAERLVHLVNEIFLDFLYDGRYYAYMIEVFGLDPDLE